MKWGENDWQVRGMFLYILPSQFLTTYFFINVSEHKNKIPMMKDGMAFSEISTYPNANVSVK